MRSENEIKVVYKNIYLCSFFSFTYYLNDFLKYFAAKQMAYSLGIGMSYKEDSDITNIK